MANFYDTQLKNRNLLSPVGFKLTLNTKRKIDFFSNTATIPALTLGTALQTTPLRNLDVPGDELLYDDFQIEFLVDEDLVNYMVVHNWLTGLGFPETPQQYKDVTTEDNVNSINFGKQETTQAFSDASLYILNSNYRTTAIVKYEEIFPVSLTSLEFEATDTDINYFTAEANFKYTVYNIFGADGRTRL